MLNKWELPGIEESVEGRKIELTLDDIVGFRGGKISYRHQKMSKSNLSGTRNEYHRYERGID